MRQLHGGVFAGCLAATLLVVAALVGIAAVGGGPIPPDGVVYMSGFLVMALAGCTILGFRPAHAIGWVFLLGGAGTLLAAFLGGIALAAGGRTGAWLSLGSLELYGVGWIAVTTLPLLLFPDGRPRGRGARVGTVAAAVLAAVVALAVAIGAQPDDGAPASPLAVTGWADAARQVLDLALLASAVVTIGAALLLALRWRRADGRERRQLAWLGVAGIAVATLVVAVWTAGTITDDLPDMVGATIEALQIAAVPVAMIGAILDARLFDIDVVFRRSLVYAVLLALIAGTYALAIGAASLVAGQSAPVVGSLVASVAVAFALSPLRDALARLVESWLYGSRRRPAEALSLLETRVGTGTDATDATDVSGPLVAAASALGTGLRLGSVAVVVESDPPILASWQAGNDSPPRESAPIELELRALGAREGRLIVTTAAGDALRREEVALIERIAPQVALVAHAVRAAALVRRSREQIVGAREAERLRLRRDLHDGLGPALVGLALQAEAAAAVAASDPSRAAELTARARAEEVGGRFLVSTGPRGTRVRAELPACSPADRARSRERFATLPEAAP